jgi:hypothetical protein
MSGTLVPPPPSAPASATLNFTPQNPNSIEDALKLCNNILTNTTFTTTSETDPQKNNNQDKIDWLVTSNITNSPKYAILYCLQIANNLSPLVPKPGGARKPRQHGGDPIYDASELTAGALSPYDQASSPLIGAQSMMHGAFSANSWGDSFNVTTQTFGGDIVEKVTPSLGMTGGAKHKLRHRK